MGWAYPPYPFKPRYRVLAYDDGVGLFTEHKEELPSDTYGRWLKSATDGHLDVRVAKIGWFRYLDESIRDERATVSAVHNESDSGPRMVRIDWRLGNKRATLYGADSWEDGVDAEAIKTHQEACDLLDAGTWPMPAALGDATLRSTLGRATAARARLRCLPLACTEDVREALVGLRAEVFAPRGACFPVATEIDRSSAYVTECLEPVPVGRVRPFHDESEIGEGEWYIALCVVTILITLDLGPFPIRTIGTTLTWPTRRGLYQGVWLTRGEIVDCRQTGCLVQILRGWAWEAMQPILRPWAQKMLAARAKASTAVAPSIKRAGNATVGRFAMSGIPLRVNTATFVGTPIVTDGLLTAYVAIPDAKRSVVSLPHLALFIWSENRRHLYHRQLAEISSGARILLSNADALILDRPSVVPMDGWRDHTLTNLVIVDNRSYVCDQKAVLPGRTGEIRESTIEWAERYAWEKEQWRKDHPLETYLSEKRWRQNGASQLTSLSSKSWPSYGDHLADLADVVIDAGIADSYAAGG